MQQFYLKKVPTIEDVNNSIANKIVNINNSFRIPEVTQVPSGISLYGLPTVGRYVYVPYKRKNYNYESNFSYNRFTDPYEISSLSDAFLNRAGRERLTGRKENDFLDYIANTAQALGYYAKESYIDPLLEFNVAELVVNGIGALGEDLDTFANPIKGMAVESGQDAGDVLANVAVAVTTGLIALLATGAVTTVGAGIGAAAGLAALGGTVGTAVRALVQDAEGAALGVERALGLGDEGRYTYDLDSGNMFGNFLIEFSVDPLNFISMGTGALRDIAPQVFKETMSESTETVLKTIANVGDSLDNGFTKFVMSTNPVGVSLVGVYKAVKPTWNTFLRRSTKRLESILSNPFNVDQYYLTTNQIALDCAQMLERNIETYPGALRGFPNYTNHAQFGELTKAVSEVAQAYASKYDTDTLAALLHDDIVGLMKAVKTGTPVPKVFEGVSNLETMLRALETVPVKNGLSKKDIKAFEEYADGIMSVLTMQKSIKDTVTKSFNDVITKTNDILANRKSASLRKALANNLGVDEVNLEQYLVKLANSSDPSVKAGYDKIYQYILDYQNSALESINFNRVHLTLEERAKLETFEDYSVMSSKLKETQDTIEKLVAEGIEKGNVESDAIEEVLSKVGITWEEYLDIEAKKNLGLKNVFDFRDRASLLLFASKDDRIKAPVLIQSSNKKMLENFKDLATENGFDDIGKFLTSRPELSFMEQELSRFMLLSTRMYALWQKILHYKPSKSKRMQLADTTYNGKPAMSLYAKANAVLSGGSADIYDNYLDLLEAQKDVLNKIKALVNANKGEVPTLVKQVQEFIGNTRLTTQDSLLSLAQSETLEDAIKANQILYRVQLNKTAQTVDQFLTLSKYDEQLSDFADTTSGFGVVLKAFSELAQTPDEILGSFKDGPEICKEILDRAVGYTHLRELMLAHKKADYRSKFEASMAKAGIVVEKVEPKFKPMSEETAKVVKKVHPEKIRIGNIIYNDKEEFLNVVQFFRDLKGDSASQIVRLQGETSKDKFKAGKKFAEEAFTRDVQNAYSYAERFVKKHHRMPTVAELENALNVVDKYDFEVTSDTALTSAELADVHAHIKGLALANGKLPSEYVMPKLDTSSVAKSVKQPDIVRVAQLTDRVVEAIKVNKLSEAIRLVNQIPNTPETSELVEQLSKALKAAEDARISRNNNLAKAKTLFKDAKSSKLPKVEQVARKTDALALTKEANATKKIIKEKTKDASELVAQLKSLVKDVKFPEEVQPTSTIRLLFKEKVVEEAVENIPKVTKIPGLNVVLDQLHRFNTTASAKQLLDNKEVGDGVLYDKFMSEIEEPFRPILKAYLKAQAERNLSLIHLPDENFIKAVDKFLTTDLTPILRQMRNSEAYRQYINTDTYSKIFGRDFYNKTTLAKQQSITYSMKLDFKKIGKLNADAHNLFITVPKSKTDFDMAYNQISKDFGLKKVEKLEDFNVKLDKEYNREHKMLSQSEALKERIKNLLEMAGVKHKDPFAKEAYEEVSKALDETIENASIAPGLTASEAVGNALGAKMLYDMHYLYNIVEDGKVSTEMYDKLNILAKRNGDTLTILAQLTDLASTAAGTRYMTEEGFNTIAHNTGLALQNFTLQDALSFLKYNTAGGTLVVHDSVLTSSEVFSPEVYEELIKRGVTFNTKGHWVKINAQTLLSDDTIPYKYTAKYSAPNAIDEDYIAGELTNILEYKERYTGVPTPFTVNTAVDVRLKGEVYLNFLNRMGFIDGDNEDIIFKALQDAKRMNYSVIGEYRYINDEVQPISANALKHLDHEIMSTVHNASKEVAYTNSLMGPELKLKNLFKDSKTGELVSPETILENYKLFNANEDGNMIFVAFGNDLKVHKLPIENVDDVRRALELNASVMSLPIYNGMYKNVNPYELPKAVQIFKRDIQGIFNAGYLTSVGTVARNFMDAFIKNYIVTGDPEVWSYMLKVPKQLKQINEILIRIGNTAVDADRIKLLDELTDKERHLYELFKTYSDLDLASSPLEVVVAMARKSAGKAPEIKTSNSLGKMVWDNPLTKFAMQGFESAESVARFGLFCYYMEKGLTDSVTEVATKIIKTHFDYGVKTPVEAWLQVLYPFTKFPIENHKWWAENAPKAYGLIKTTTSVVTDEWLYRQPGTSDYSTNQLLNGNLTIGDTLVKWNPSLMDALTFVPSKLIDPTDGMSASILNIAKAVNHGVNTLLGKDAETPDYDYPWETNLKRVAKIVTQTIPSMVEGDIGEAPNLVPSLFSKSSSEWKTEADAYGRSGWVPKEPTMMNQGGRYTPNRARPVYNTGTGAGTASTKAYASYTGYAANRYSSGITKYASRYPQKYYHRNAKLRYLPEMYKQHYTSGGYSRMLMKAKNGPMSPETLSYRLNDLKYQFKK